MANSLNRDIKTGEIVVVNVPSMQLRRFKCYSGFGMFKDTVGSLIFGEWVDDSETDWISGYTIDPHQTAQLKS